MELCVRETRGKRGKTKEPKGEIEGVPSGVKDARQKTGRCCITRGYLRQLGDHDQEKCKLISVELCLERK